MQKQQINIVFVCTGNTCRSPMAEAIARYKALDMDADITFRSAGVATVDGLPMSGMAMQVLERHGLHRDQLEHVSQVVTEELLEWADLVLTMTENHKRKILNSFPKYENKIYNFSLYIYNKDKDIVDPFGGSFEVYSQCANELEQTIEALLLKIKQ